MKTGSSFSKIAGPSQGLHITAFHEAGHTIAAWHFGIYCWAEIVRVKGGWSGASQQPGITGNRTVFRSAVVAWAGAIAQGLADGSIERADLLGSYFGWIMESMDTGYFGLAGDREYLDSIGYLYRSRPVRIAARILDRRYRELVEAARELESECFLESWVDITSKFPNGRPLPSPT